MKVVLLEPTASVLGLSTYAAHNILEPLGLEYLATYLESKCHTCHVVQQRCETRESVLAEITGLKPTILGISTQAYNIDDGLWFAAEAKKALPGLIVVVGGYHASAMPDLAERPEVDYVVIGEGEIAFERLLAALNGGQEALAEIPGIAYFDGSLHVNLRAERIGNLDSLPIPRRNKKILAQCRMHGLMYPPPSQQTYVGMITATRGCPYSCSFCSSQLIWNNKIHRRSPQNVVEELEMLANEYDVNAVFFCDLTFNANKKYAIDLCNQIARRDVPIHFYAMCNLRGMDREIAEAMAAAKCSKVGFGVESFTDIVRSNMKDQGGMDLSETNQVLREVCAGGVLTKAYFIIGFPWETHESLMQLKSDISQLYADEIKVTFYVPFPGTKGYELHRSLLTTTAWANFTTLSAPIVKNDNVTPDEFSQIRKDIFSKFYNGQSWQGRVTKRIEAFPKYRDSFAEFADFLHQQGILHAPLTFPVVAR